MSKQLLIISSMMILITSFENEVKSQCVTCGNPRVYTSTTTNLDGNSNPGGGLNSSRWDNNSFGNFLINEIAEFRGTNVSYTWTANDFTIGGIILKNGADLTLDRPNNGENPSFNIIGNCVVIGEGSVLNLKYITELRDISICIEEGGKLILDSRTASRNNFTFENVIITLDGPESLIELGEIEIIEEGGGLVIDGWTGYDSDICKNPSLASSGSSGNISWTDTNDIIQLCGILNGRILPLEWAYLNSALNRTERSVLIKWGTHTRWNNSWFEIERSMNGIVNWEPIGVVKKPEYQGIIIDYKYIDKNIPLAGGSVFYRIKQIDFTGKHTLSSVSGTLIPPIHNSESKTWRVYPNPTNGFNFKIDALHNDQYSGEEITFRLSGNDGDLSSFTAYTLEELNVLLKPLIEQASPGLLFLELRWGRSSDIIKIIKK